MYIRLLINFPFTYSVIPNLRYGRVTVITLPINEDEDVLQSFRKFGTLGRLINDVSHFHKYLSIIMLIR